VRAAIDRAIDGADAEHQRRTQGGAPSLLLHASAEAAGDAELTEALEALEACADPFASASTALLDMLAELCARHGGVRGGRGRGAAGIPARARARCEQQNPVLIERTCAGAAARLGGYVDELMRATLSLLARVPA